MTAGRPPDRADAQDCVRSTFRRAFVDVSPILLAATPFGLLLGSLAGANGMSPVEMAAMSALIFAGGSQFVAVDLLAEGVGVIALSVAVAAVNLRHTLMSLTLAPYLGGFRRRTVAAMLFGMTDEVWALSLARARSGRPITLAYWFSMVGILWVFWSTVTGLGAVVGQGLPAPEALGADVAFAVIFMILLAGLYRGRSDIAPWIAAGAAAVAAERMLPGVWYFIVAGAVGAAVAAILHRPADRDDEPGAGGPMADPTDRDAGP